MPRTRFPMRSASLAALFWTVAGCARVLAGDAWDGVPIPGTQIPSSTLTIIKPKPPLKPEPAPKAEPAAKPEPPLSTDKDIARGVTTTEAQCKALATALWLRVNGRRFCIRYWISTAGGSKNDALISLHGDIGGLIDGKVRLAEEAEHHGREASAERGARFAVLS